MGGSLQSAQTTNLSCTYLEKIGDSLCRKPEQFIDQERNWQMEIVSVDCQFPQRTRILQRHMAGPTDGTTRLISRYGSTDLVLDRARSVFSKSTR